MKISKITKNDQSFVMTPDHVHRLQKKMRIEKVKERMGKSPIAIGVDERKDKTKVRTGDGQRGSKRYQVVKEDHATVIFWPEETYEGHVVPSGGSAKALAKSFIDFLLERRTDLGQLRALLGDGTSKVTGCWGGFMAEVERLVSKELGEPRPLQHIICMLHHAEKIFEKYFFTMMELLLDPMCSQETLGLFWPPALFTLRRLSDSRHLTIQNY